jgi:hypothetical protein
MKPKTIFKKNTIPLFLSLTSLTVLLTYTINRQKTITLLRTIRKQRIAHDLVQNRNNLTLNPNDIQLAVKLLAPTGVLQINKPLKRLYTNPLKQGEDPLLLEYQLFKLYMQTENRHHVQQRL